MAIVLITAVIIAIGIGNSYHNGYYSIDNSCHILAINLDNGCHNRH